MDTAAAPLTATEPLSAATVDFATGAVSPPETSPAVPVFAELVATFQAAQQAWKSLPADASFEDTIAAEVAIEEAVKAVFASSAPTPWGLLQKLTISLSEDRSPDFDERESILSDARHLLRREAVYGVMAGTSGGLCFAASDWAAKLREAAEAKGDAAIDAAVDAATKRLPPIFEARVSTVSDLTLKLRVLCCEYFGNRQPDHPEHWPEPVFHGAGEWVPSSIMRRILEDAEVIAYRAAPQDRVDFVKGVASTVDEKANGADLSLVYVETLLRSLRSIIDNDVIGLLDLDIGLGEGQTRHFRAYAEDQVNILDLVESKISEARANLDTLARLDITEKVTA